MDDLKARGEASPDDGDTLAMTFAVQLRAREKPQPEKWVHAYPETLGQQWMQ